MCQFKYKYYVFLSLLLNIILTAYSAYHFTSSGHPEYVVYKSDIILACSVILGIFSFVKLALLVYYTKNKIEKKRRAAIELTIGYGLMFVCGFSGQSHLMFELRKDLDHIVDLYSWTFGFTFTAGIITLLFIFPHFSLEMSASHKELLCGRISGFACHFSFTLIIHVLPIFLGDMDKKVYLHVLFIVCYYPLVFGCCTAEFIFSVWSACEEEGEESEPVKKTEYSTNLYLLLNKSTHPDYDEWFSRQPCLCGNRAPNHTSIDFIGVELLPETDRCLCTVPTPQRIAPDEEEEGDDLLNSTGLECDVCMLPFSSLVVPRILVGCGHTICQGCVSNLLRNDTVLCPFCRKPTSVPGGLASQLPKHYSLLAMVQ